MTPLAIPTVPAVSLIPSIDTPLADDVTSLAKVLETVAPTVMPCDHTQASRTTAHGV